MEKSIDLASVFREVGVAVTVTDREGAIVYYNDSSARVNAGGDGHALLGRDVRGCHNERSRAIIERLFAGETNVYTITKKGQRKLIYQTPWKVDGEVQGLVELSIVVPDGIPHYSRD